MVVKSGKLSMADPTLVCRGETVLYLDDQSATRGMASRAGDEPVPLSLAGRSCCLRSGSRTTGSGLCDRSESHCRGLCGPACCRW